MVLPRLAGAPLAAIASLVGDARIVAIGEGAHNVTQFHELKDELVRFLVGELGFTAVVLESGFAEGLTVDGWIHGAADSVERVARDGITYHFGECEPMRRHLTWLREWNAAHAEKVSFYGMDLPGSSTSPGSAVGACLERLPAQPGDDELRRRSELGGRVQAARRYEAMPETERAQLLDGIAQLVQRAATSADPVVHRCAGSLQAWVAFVASPTGADPREEFMAETVRWVAEREPRLVVCAHNAHVQRTPYLGRSTIGGLLDETFGSDLVVIGTTYGCGPELLITDRSPRPFDWDVSLSERMLPPDSIEAVLDRDDRPVHVADLHGAPPDAFAGVSGYVSGGRVLPVPDLRRAFDALIHVRVVTAVPGSFERLREEVGPR